MIKIIGKWYKALWEGMQKVRAFALALAAGRPVYAGDG